LILSSDEWGRAMRFVDARDRERFAKARWSLRNILARYLTISPENIVFSYGTHGKPSLKNSAVQFNLSHAGDYGLLAIARDAVGVDIEIVRTNRDFLALAERFFAPQEYAALLALPAKKRMSAFYRCWTRKEAFIKATGDGLSLSLAKFEVIIDDVNGTDSVLKNSYHELNQSVDWTICVVPDLPAGITGAVALQRKIQKMHLWRAE